MERLKAILNNLGLDDPMAEVFSYIADKRKATLEEIYEETPLSRKAISEALDALEAEGSVKREGPAFTIENVREALMALLPARYEELKAEIYSYRPIAVKKECPLVEASREEASALPSLASKRIDAALREVDIISRSLAWLDDESLGAARDAVQRGVRIRVITYQHPGLEADARVLADAGVEVRCHGYSNGVGFTMIDGEFIALDIKEPPGATPPAHFSLTIRDRDVFEKMHEHIFETAWREAKIVEKYRI